MKGRGEIDGEKKEGRGVMENEKCERWEKGKRWTKRERDGEIKREK